MTTTDNSEDKGFTGEWKHRENLNIINGLNIASEDHKTDIRRLKTELIISYWLIVIFSSFTFILGFLLLVISATAATGEENKLVASIITGAAGIADLITLFLYRPIARIQKIMGDMSQIILLLNSYEYQVGLALMEMDIDIKESVGAAADKIGKIAYTTIVAIEKFFEAKEAESKSASS
jgi:hypothetical protein